MQDIDFDELDRAVTSASGRSTPAVETPSSDTVPVTVQSSPRAEASATPAARRSSGRFMDVVHPSSDMRSSTPERSAQRPPEDKPAERTTDWPDPLDFHGFTGEEPATPAVEPTVEPAEDASAATSLESPFLSGTKVEKRPLGAFSTADLPEPETSEKDEPLLLEPSDEPLLPAETDTAEDLLVPETPEEEPAQPETAPEVPAAPPVVEESTAPVSITQQYKEQPSTTQQPSGAIFDTESYHKPLAHPEKKKSGALVVVWIIALILVGAGAGAAVYFFVLPML